MKVATRLLTTEAIQLRKNNLKDVEAFMGGETMYGIVFDINWGNSHVKVQTIDGKRTVTPGMWIVKGVLGRLSVYRDDVFRETFTEL